MSKEEFLKIQTCVLKVNIHCDGCKQKVKKILQKIDGVYTIKIDSEQGKVTVSGNVGPTAIIKKLVKNGKHAELWGAPKPVTQLPNQLKNLQLEGGKGGNNKGNNKPPQGQKGTNNQPKGGGGGGGTGGGQPQLPPQFHQMKGFPDMKLPPQFMKMPALSGGGGPPGGKGWNGKPGGSKLPPPPVGDGSSDEEFDDDDDEFDDDDYDDDDEFDDEDDLDDIIPPNKLKPAIKAGNGLGSGPGPHIPPNVLMSNMMNGLKGGGNKSAVGNSNHNGAPQYQFAGNMDKNGGQNKIGAGGPPNMNGFMVNEGKKGGGMNDGPHGMPNTMMAMNRGSGGHMGGGNHSQMGNLAAVQGLPAMNGGHRSEHVAGNPYHNQQQQQQQQQQLAAMMMNQQRANGNERFQPMMYARPPPAVNYMPPPPYGPPLHQPYPYPPPPGERADQFAMFSDENTSSCSLM